MFPADQHGFHVNQTSRGMMGRGIDRGALRRRSLGVLPGGTFWWEYLEHDAK